jgi:WD40 repeat protein
MASLGFALGAMLGGIAATTGHCAPAPESAKEPVRLHTLEVAAPGYLAFAADGKTLIHAAGRTMRFWEVATGKEQTTWEKKDWFVKDLAPDGSSVALLRGRDDLRLFEAATGKERCALAGDHDLYGASNHFIYSPDGKMVVADYFGKDANGVAYTVRFWDAANGKEQEPIKGLKQGIVRSMAVSRDGNYLAIGCEGTDILLYDLAKREVLRGFGEQRVPNPRDLGLDRSSPSRIVAITAVTFSPDGKTVAAGDNDGTVYLYETATGKKTLRLGDGPKSLKEAAPCVGQLLFSPDGKTLLVVDSYLGRAPVADRCERCKLHLWDMATGKERPSLKLEGAVHFAALSPDGKHLAVVLMEEKKAWVELWEVPALVKDKKP